VNGVAAHGLVVEHGNRRVVDGVDLVAHPGEWVSVVGPNGAGKTTLLHVLAGVVTPDEGTVEICGRDGRQLRTRERARLVALVPQVPVVPPAIRVLDYVLLGRTPHLPFLGTETAADLARAHDTLSLLGLEAFAERRVETLSGGERQRVLIARALLQEPRVLLLDEPTSALDIGHQQEVLELIDRLRHDQELTVISTLHDLTLAGLYADGLVLLADGRVVDRGDATDVLTPDRLRQHFGAHVTVLAGADGPIVVPHRVVRSAP
jgi:iron complex transport system ATP-binding protein